MTENKKQATSAENESQQANRPFQNSAVKKEEKDLSITAKETKPAFQTYIYRSYGGGYQGL